LATAARDRPDRSFDWHHSAYREAIVPIFIGRGAPVRAFPAMKDGGIFPSDADAPARA